MRDEEREGFEHRLRRASCVSSRSEFDFINSIRQKALRGLNPSDSSLIYGIGDDAAVFEQRGGLCSVVTADLLVEEVDFRLTTTRPRLLGHKALAVSLSDIAAMGARPRWSLLSVGVPPRIWRSDFLDTFYEGFFELADRYGVRLVGGDVSRTPEIVVIDSIVIGEAARASAVMRSGARPGDHIFVTGSLGAAHAGLLLLENEIGGGGGGGALRARAAVERAIGRHRRPEPRLGWGLMLGTEGLATAMIDISDGLSSDLLHLCRESRVGALVDARRIPVDPLLEPLADELRLDPLEAALGGGEDFELLFTVAPVDMPHLPKSVGGVPATYIGDVKRERDGVVLRRGGSFRRLNPRGYSHF